MSILTLGPDATRVVRSTSRGDNTANRSSGAQSEIGLVLPFAAVSNGDLLEGVSTAVDEKQALLAVEDGAVSTPSSTGGSKRHKRRERRVRRPSTEHAGPSVVHDAWRLLWEGSRLSGVLCVAASCICSQLMGILVKLLEVHEIPPFELLMLRCTLVAAFAGAGLKRAGIPLQGRVDGNDVLLGLRALAGFAAIWGFFYSIQALDAPDAMALNSLTPLVAPAFALLFLKERWGLWDAFAAVGGYIGVVMLTQPPLLLGPAVKGWEALQLPVQRQFWLIGTWKAREKRDLWSDTIAVVVALLAVLLGAAALCLVRAIMRSSSQKEGGAGVESPLVPVFAFAAIAAPLAGIFSALLRQFVVPSVGEFLGMVIVAGLAFLSQMLLARGLQLERISRVMPVLYTKSLVTNFFGVLFFSERPSLLGALGGIVVIGSVAVSAYLGEDKREPVDAVRV